MAVFNQADELLKRRRKPVQPTGSVLSGIGQGTATRVPPTGIGAQPLQQPVQPQIAPQQTNVLSGLNQPTPQPQPVPPKTVGGEITPSIGILPTPTPTPTPPPPIVGPTQPDLLPTDTTPIQVTPQDANILSSLNPELAALVQQAIQDQVSGAGFGAAKAVGDEAFATATQQYRAQGGAGAALGQGSANARQNTTEAQILQAVGQKGLQDALGLQESISKGIGQAVDLAKLNTSQSNFLNELQFKYDGLASQKDLQAIQINANAKLAADKNWLVQQGIDLENAKLYGYEDANGNWVMGSLQMNNAIFQSQMNSAAGQSFANYITANPNTNIDDPAVQAQGQALWEALGNEGPVDQQWLQARIEAVKDPSLTNPIMGTKAMLDAAVESGDISQEQADEFFDNFLKQLSGEEETGNVFGDKYPPGSDLRVYNKEDRLTIVSLIEAGNQAVIDRHKFTGPEMDQFISESDNGKIYDRPITNMDTLVSGKVVEIDGVNWVVRKFEKIKGAGDLNDTVRISLIDPKTGEQKVFMRSHKKPT